MFLTLLDNVTIPALMLLFPQDGLSSSSRVVITVSGQVPEQLGC